MGVSSPYNNAKRQNRIMTRIEISFLSLSYSTDIILESMTSIDDVAFDLILLFAKVEDINPETGKIDIRFLQQNTLELRQSIDKFIEHYKDAEVRVFQLRSYFQKLNENEKFLIWFGDSLTTEQREQFYIYLDSLKQGNDYETARNQLDELFGELRKTYDIQDFNEKTNKTIGEQDKSKRICRFCNNTRPSPTFKNIAHAISESLGNKKIILNEECDQCNSEFGSASGIETSLITFLKIYGIFFGVKGKNKIPKLKGKNFELSNEGQLVISHSIKNNDFKNKNNSLTEAELRLDTFDNIIMQDIYKTLCKYFISVVDSSILFQFEDTISWINNKTIIEKLPFVAILSSYNYFNIHPSLVIYIRQDDNKDLPYAVGEFHYTFLTFVFIIPLAKADSEDFIDEKAYKTFWNFFKHYSAQKDWDFKNFSDSGKRKFSLNLNFELKKKDEK